MSGLLVDEKKREMAECSELEHTRPVADSRCSLLSSIKVTILVLFIISITTDSGQRGPRSSPFWLPRKFNHMDRQARTGDTVFFC
jgi:hypothetical protein